MNINVNKEEQKELTDYIKQLVANYFNVDKDLPFQKENDKMIYARRIAIYLCRIHGDMYIPKIELEFNADAYVVLSICNKIEKEIAENEYTRKVIEELSAKIEKYKLNR